MKLNLITILTLLCSVLLGCLKTEKLLILDGNENKYLNASSILKSMGLTHYCNGIAIKNHSKVNLEELKKILNELNVECVSISYKDSTISFSNIYFTTEIYYLYDFSEEGKQALEFDAPRASSYLKKIKDRWYYGEAGFD